MNRIIALVLLVAGVCVAATAGSQLGAEQASRTPVTAQAGVAGGIVGKVAGCADSLDKTLRKIERKVEAEELTTEEAETERAEATEASVACRTKAIAPWTGVEEPTDAQLDAAYEEARQAAAEASEVLEAEPRLEPGARVSEWFSAGGIVWSLGLVLIVAGAVLGRRAAYQAATAPSTSGTAALPMDEALRTLRARIAEARPLVAALSDGQDSVQARGIIEALEADVMAPVVDERDRYKARDGIATFAEYFGPFSAGERNLARAWSALTDGYPHVALDALDTAELAFGQAAQAYARAAG